MRLVESITYKKAKLLERFSIIQKKIEKLVQKSPESNIAKMEISELNYFLVIDCKDVSKKLGIDYTSSDINLLFGTKENNESFMKHIRKKNTQPSFFKNLGLLYDITGCYIVATSKNVKKNVSIYNTLNSVSCKFDLDELPIDFKNMCSDYENKELNFDNTNMFNFANILNIPNEDRDKIIESIIDSLSLTEIPIQEMYSEISFEDMYGDGKNSVNLESVIENKIDDIYDIKFLQQVMDGAIEKDNLELCAKIRDRIKKIKKTK